MGFEAWITIGVVLLVLGLLVGTRGSPDIILIGGVTLLMILGIITPSDALSGLSNEGMVTVGVLYIVVAGLEATGATTWMAHRVLGQPRSLFGALFRMMTPVIGLSAFLNNTPVVAMFMPAVTDWARRNRLSASKLLMPLSYAAILGGCCTLIGTSTNLIVNGLLLETGGLPRLGMFDIAWVGLPCAVVGGIGTMVLTRRLLPDRRPAISKLDDPRSYTVEMLIESGSPLIGKTIEQAGLRQLPGMYLAEIDREGQVFPAVAPQERLRAEDRLVFVGIVGSVIDLQKIRGLKPATDQVFKLDAPRAQRCLVEAVVSSSCPIIGQTIRDGRFRSVYNAVVIAAARAGERIQKKIGDIVLQPGDTLLLEAHPSFAEQQRNSRDFYLVSQVENSSPPRHDRALGAVAIMVGMIILVTLNWLSMLQASMLAAGLMIITRCSSSSVARRSVDWGVLLAIAASLGLGRALDTSGVARHFADSLIGLAGGGAWATLAMVYLVTVILTELITNNAAAVLVFPIALASANSLHVDFTPFAMAIMMAASCGFATPMGYQTHMMVYGPGGYRFTDFMRVGIPMDLMIGVVCVILIPFLWPFQPLAVAAP